MPDFGDNVTTREALTTLHAELSSERSSFLSHWRAIASYLLPYRPRFVTSDTNRGERKNQKIIDNTATLAHRTMVAGLKAGITSPARPWFRLTTPDPDLAEFGPAKEWLHALAQRMHAVYAKSNVYNTFTSVYGDNGAFGTAAMSVEEDFDDVLFTQSFPPGSFMIAQDHKGRVNTFFREFRLTVDQLVKRFGRMTRAGEPDWSNFSEHVRELWERRKRQQWIDVWHVVQPNDGHDPKKMHPRHRRFSEHYVERGFSSASASNYLGGRDDERYLHEGGYDRFPILAGRWELSGQDVYGTNCPGMTAIDDVKSLQSMQRKKLQAIEKMVNPPLKASSGLMKSSVAQLPGAITWLELQDLQAGGVEPLHQLDPRLQELVFAIQDNRELIRRAFHEDLFLMLAQSRRAQITAREIEERHEEKLVQLGPMLEQWDYDILKPLIEATFDIMMRRGWVPEPPPELEGVELKVEFISIMAQAQKLAGIQNVERFAQFVGSVAAFDPSVLDKVDRDQMIDVYGDKVGVDPTIIVPDEEVAELRMARAQAQKAQQAAEMAKQATGAVKDLSQADLEGDNALTRVLRQVEAGAAVQPAA